MSERSEGLKSPPPGPSALASGSGLALLPYALPSTERSPHLGATGGLTRGDAAAIALRLSGAYCLLRAGEMMVQLPSIVTISRFRIYPPAPEIGLEMRPS